MIDACPPSARQTAPITIMNSGIRMERGRVFASAAQSSWLGSKARLRRAGS